MAPRRSMDIDSKKGSKIVFKRRGYGGPNQVEFCDKHLKIGELYTICTIIRGTKKHGGTVYLEEFPEMINGFTTLSFDNYK